MNFSLGFIASVDQLQLSNKSTSSDSEKYQIYIYISTIINIILGSPIHCLVLWLICKGKGSGFISEFFSLNLAVCELLWCLCSTSVIVAFWIPELYYVAIFIYSMPTVGRSLFHCLICLERYLAVLHPVSFLRFKPLRYRLACSAVVWANIPLFGVFYFFVLFTGKTKFLFKVSMPLIVLCLCFKLFCLSTVLKVLKFPRTAQRVTMNRNKEARQKLRKATTQILIITMSMLAQYLPVLINASLYESVSANDFYFMWFVTYMFSSLVAFVNPVLHICKVKKISCLPDLQ